MTKPRRGQGQKRATLTQVAERASVHPSVASRALTGDPRARITEATRQRIHDAARELGYRPNAAARGLRTARTGTIGLAIPAFANPVYAEVIAGADASALSSGRMLLTGELGDEREVTAYLDRLDPGRVDGLLLAAGAIGETVQEVLDDLGVPWLLVNRRGHGVRRTLTLDDHGGAELASRHLLELGHRRIALIRGPDLTDTSHRREAGFRAALRDADVVVDEELIEVTDYSYQAGAAAMQRLLAHNEPPTAVIVANIGPAMGALRAATEGGLEVPKDCSVVAVHDLPLAEVSHPPLTTVRMPLWELGRRAVELLGEASAEAPIDEVCSEPMDLVIRDSTARPRIRSRFRGSE